MVHTPPQAVLHTLLAHFAIAKESCSRTQQSEIVECLNNRDASPPACAIYGRRNHDERIVDVYEIWILPSKESGKFALRIGGPNASLHEGQSLQSGKCFDFVVAPAIRDHLIAGLL